jgi:hypothetical protein
VILAGAEGQALRVRPGDEHDRLGVVILAGLKSRRYTFQLATNLYCEKL